MRLFLTGLAALAAFGGEAAASSFVTLPATDPADTPSIVTIGAADAQPIEARPIAAAEPEIYALGPSIIAFGIDAIPVVSDEVASIGEEKKPDRPQWHPDAIPLVIRGGVVGNAFSAPTPPDVALSEEDMAADEGEPEIADPGPSETHRQAPTREAL